MSVKEAVLAMLMLPVSIHLVALSALATLATKEMDWTVQVSDNILPWRLL